jgi:hypothetical protein
VPAHLPHERDTGERRLELVAQPDAARANMLDEPLRAERREDGQADRGAPSQVWPSVKRREPFANAS